MTIVTNKKGHWNMIIMRIHKIYNVLVVHLHEVACSLWTSPLKRGCTRNVRHELLSRFGGIKRSQMNREDPSHATIKRDRPDKRHGKKWSMQSCLWQLSIRRIIDLAPTFYPWFLRLIVSFTPLCCNPQHLSSSSFCSCELQFSIGSQNHNPKFTKIAILGAVSLNCWRPGG